MVTYLENSGRVVVNGVDTRSVLPEEQHAAQEQAVHDLVVGVSSLEGLPEAKTNGRALLFQGLVNGADLLNDVDVVLGKLAHPAQVLDSLLTATTGEQPTRGLPDKDATDQQKAGRDKLYGKGNDPLFVAGGHSRVDTIL